jgi:hypothetical protein
MKVLQLFVLSFILISSRAFAAQGCLEQSYLLGERCAEANPGYRTAINDQPYPLVGHVNMAQNIRSTPQNPLIIDAQVPLALTYGEVAGPWEIRSPSSVNVHHISEWPYVAARLYLVINSSPPPGMPKTAPGISCTVIPYPNAFILNCN